MARQVEFLAAGLTDENGDPYSSGTVNFYTVGTTTDKTIWEDIVKATPASNPVTLDSQGRAEVYAEGSYKVVVKDSDAATIKTFDEMYFETGTEAPADGSIDLDKLDATVKGLLGGVKNQARNGDFRFWSAGTSITGAPAVDIADGWFYDEDADSGTAVNTTISQNTVTIGGESIAERVPKYSMNIANADNGSSLGASSYHQVSTRIYGVEKLSGETITVSFDAKSDIEKVVYICAHQYFGSGGSPSTSVYTEGGRKTTTTAYGTRLSQSISIPEVSSKTLGSNDDDYLEIIISLQHGVTRGATIADSSGALVYDTSTGYVRIANFQVEIGSSSTSFELRPYILDGWVSDSTGRLIRGFNTDPSGINTSAQDVLFGSESTHAGMTIVSGTSHACRIVFGDTDDADQARITYDNSTDALSMQTNSGSSATMTGAGGLAIAGTSGGAFAEVTNGSYTGAVCDMRCSRAASSAYILYNGEANSVQRFVVDGLGDVTNTNNSYGAISDKKLKTQIEESSSQLKDVIALGNAVKKYKLNKDVEDNGDKAITQLGLVAQDVKEISPNLVGERLDYDIKINKEGKKERVLNGEKTLNVKYSVISIKLLKAFAEYVNKNDNEKLLLNDKLKEMEARLSRLESK